MILLPSLWPAVCLLADAFISLTLYLAYFYQKSSAWPLLKAAEHSCSVSISIDITCLTFKPHSRMSCPLRKQKGWVTVLDPCHSILVSGTRVYLVALRPVWHRTGRGRTLTRQRCQNPGINRKSHLFPQWPVLNTASNKPSLQPCRVPHLNWLVWAHLSSRQAQWVMHRLIWHSSLWPTLQLCI